MTVAHLLISLSRAALLASLAVVGCSETTTTEPDIQPTFTSIQNVVLTSNCATESCHSAAGQRGGMVLAPGVAYDNLVGVTPTNDSARNHGLKRVVPGKPDSSFLLRKLTGPGTGEGDKMPQTGGSIGTKAIEAIRTWIANGAPRN